MLSVFLMVLIIVCVPCVLYASFKKKWYLAAFLCVCAGVLAKVLAANAGFPMAVLIDLAKGTFILSLFVALGLFKKKVG